MHPVAVKCIRWAVGLFIFGGLTSAYGTEFLMWLSESTGATGIAGFRFMNVLFGILQWSLMPLAGSLVGAAVVIQTLAPYVRDADDTDFDETEVEADGASS
jgi:hypothetical protein